MSRIHRDLRRFEQIGQDYRMDLKQFIKYGHLGRDIKIPIKTIELPGFEYMRNQKGGLGQGDVEVGDPVDEQGDGEGEDQEPGEETGEHGYYPMDPEEFAESLDDELGLNFEPKGNKVVEIDEGDFNDTQRVGPNSTLDKDYLFKQAVKRHAAIYIDTEYIKELLRVKGWGVKKVWNWARENNIKISEMRVEELNKDIKNPTKYDSMDEIGRSVNRVPPRHSYSNMTFRRDDERYRAPEKVEKPQHNAVVINIRDVSASMREKKREFVERVFTPLDWYLHGKYDNVDFVYIAHDAQAWIVNREEFFTIKSGGGTRVSSAYELIKSEILPQYPWNSWNRYIFAAGDGENKMTDTKNNLIPLMKEIDATRQAYVEVQPNRGFSPRNANVADDLYKEFKNEEDEYRIVSINSRNEVIDAIKMILDTVETEVV